MAHVDLYVDDVDFEGAVLVEGLPGAGLVGKIVVDHLVDEFDMRPCAGVYCEGVPPVASYRGNESTVHPPVRVHAAPEEGLLVLQSDIPVSPVESPEFAACVTDWIADHDVDPVYVSSLVGDDGDLNELYGLSTAGGETWLDEAGVVPPRHAGLVSGPTGALLHRADEIGLSAVALVVASEGGAADPAAARTVIDYGVEPIAGVEVDTAPLVEGAADIRAATEALAERLRNSSAYERSEARPVNMFR